VGAPSTPRPAVFTRPTKILRPPLAVPPRPGPAPRSPSHLPGLWVTRHQRGFTHVRPSGLPLACAPGWNGTRFGFFPELRTPQLPATHVRAGTGLEHWPGATPPTSSALQSAHSLATCNLVSHVLGPIIPCKKPQGSSRPCERSRSAACGRTISDLMKQCSRHTPAGTTSQQRSTLPASRQGHDLSSGLPKGARGGAVLTCRRLPDPSLPDGRPVNSH
jgi:hypothetical protein